MNKLFKQFIENIMYGGHLSSLGAASIAYSTGLLLDIKIGWGVLLAVYSGTEAIYLYNRFKENRFDTKTNPERTKYINKLMRPLPFFITILAVISIIATIFWGTEESLFFAATLLLFGFLYSEFLKKLTRKIFALKTFLVSCIWALLPFFVVIYYSEPVNIALLLFSLFIFFRSFVNTSFCDIKDIETDKKDGLATLPIVFGVKKLLIILSIVSFFSLTPIALGIYYKFLPLYAIMLFFIIPYSFFYLSKSLHRKMARTVVFDLLVDGEDFLCFALTLSGKFFLT